MKRRLLVFPLLLLFVGIGCGGDDESNEDWVGEWAIESLDGENVEAAFTGGVASEFVKVDLTENTMAFSKEDSWRWTFSIGFDGESLEGLPLTLEMVIQARGRYKLNGSEYAMNTESVEVTLDPPRLWAAAGVSEVELEDEFSTDLRRIETGTWRATDERLILDGIFVLRRL